MASLLRPLHIFSERYNSMLIRLVPEGELTNGINNHTPLLRTKYGLQINVNKSDEHSPIGVITFQAENQEPLDEGENSDYSRQPYHYQLFPDWKSSSYLWYNPDADNHGDPMVNDNTVDARYPKLAPFYWAWRGIYEKAYEIQGLHLGYEGDVFPDPNAQVSWEVAGFLIASWLVLQDNVESVEYYPSEGYIIRKETLEEVTKQFLEDEDVSLNANVSHEVF